MSEAEQPRHRLELSDTIASDSENSHRIFSRRHSSQAKPKKVTKVDEQKDELRWRNFVPLAVRLPARENDSGGDCPGDIIFWKYKVVKRLRRN